MTDFTSTPFVELTKRNADRVSCPDCGAWGVGPRIYCSKDGCPGACHCGKDGHALNSINCPVHSCREKTAADAPCHYGPQEADAWASGYNAALYAKDIP